MNTDHISKQHESIMDMYYIHSKVGNRMLNHNLNKSQPAKNSPSEIILVYATYS
jgi:hypothetical protein